jgi:PhnB protein
MISPAIQLPGNCAEAIALYQKAFSMTVNSIDYYRDAPPDSGMTISDDEQDKVMHAELTICGSRVNMSDSNFGIRWQLIS